MLGGQELDFRRLHEVGACENNGVFLSLLELQLLIYAYNS